MVRPERWKSPSVRAGHAFKARPDSDGLPAVGVRVVLVPEPSRRTQYTLFKEQTTDQYGHCELRGIAPGDYKLFSWEEAESGAWEIPNSCA
jgi:hypothetical protein